MRGRISFIGRGKCNEIDIVIAQANMCVPRGKTVVFVTQFGKTGLNENREN